MTKPKARSAANDNVENCLDKALAETFPSSDPPSCTNPSRGTRTDNESLKEQADRKP